MPEPLRAESVLVVLIDLAESPLSAVRTMAPEELRANAASFSECCALLDVPVLFSRAPFPGEAGAILPEVTRYLPSLRVVAHSTNDSWETPGFVEAVRAAGRRQLVFAGIATDVGVGLTALSAMRAGFPAAVVTDVCATVSHRAEHAAWARLTQAGVALTAWSSFAGEVQRDYTTAKGREVLKVVMR
jgi:nicotinamidase-related amidase